MLALSSSQFDPFRKSDAVNHDLAVLKRLLEPLTDAH
jgi:hypothetical protein